MQNPKAPSVYYSKEFGVLMDLRVYDGYLAGPKDKMATLFDYLMGKVVIKVSPFVEAGQCFDHVGATNLRVDGGMWVKSFDKYAERALELMGMTNFNSSRSPKLDK